MNPTSSPIFPPQAWEQDLRARQELGRAAFLARDVPTLDALWADELAVNSPLLQVVPKKAVFEALRAGRVGHTAYSEQIESIYRCGDVVVVMGRDRVTDPPDDVVSHRRFTNIWQLQAGRWRMIARHAQVVSREPTAPTTR